MLTLRVHGNSIRKCSQGACDCHRSPGITPYLVGARDDRKRCPWPKGGIYVFKTSGDLSLAIRREGTCHFIGAAVLIESAEEEGILAIQLRVARRYDSYGCSS